MVQRDCNRRSRIREIKTCYRWDYLKVAINIDKKFKDEFGGTTLSAHLSAAHIFVEAHQIYWEETCVYLLISSFELTENMDDMFGFYWDLMLPYVAPNACYSGTYGALHMLKELANNYKEDVDRDAYHMFTGEVLFNACAWTNKCHKQHESYGICHMAHNNNIRWQAICFR